MISQDYKAGSVLSGFMIDRIVAVPELRSEALIATHVKTGTRLMHLFNEDPNNLFSIAFRTPALDNTGAAHILEHSVLCGSKRFPLKDPFLELLKGSLQTFLNALTYPDKTIYPVSSQVEADFFNLVDVYCDAVLHPLISENTFFQEGWHFDTASASAPVTIKGIVYNEMKGVFSDFASHVGRQTLKTLFPDTSYRHESGGEVSAIPALTYTAFCDFHRRYYHPSNAFIFLYGNLPTAKTLRFLDERYLAEFDKQVVDSTVTAQVAWPAPRTHTIDAPAQPQDDGLATVTVSWLVGNATDPLLMLQGRIVSRYLLGTESSPLKRALVDSGIGDDLDDSSGFGADLVQTQFCAGLRRVPPERSDEVKQVIINTLKTITEQGPQADQLEGAIRQTEFAMREIANTGYYPYNLMLMERCFQSWIYEGDPLAHLAFESSLQSIKADPTYPWFTAFINDRLLNNPHQLLMVIRASSTKAAAIEQETAAQVAALTHSFTAADRERHAQRSAQLVAAQQQAASPEQVAMLPRLSKRDLAQKTALVPTTIRQLGPVTVHEHSIFTSGITYADLAFEIAVPEDLLPYLPLYAELLKRCGAAGDDYQAMARRIAMSCGRIVTSLHCGGLQDVPGSVRMLFGLHGSALSARCNDMASIFTDILNHPQLNAAKQIKDILLEMKNALHASVVSEGNAFAVAYAAAGLCRSRQIEEAWSGITQLRFLEKCSSTTDVEAVIEKLKTIHSLIAVQQRCMASFTAEDGGSAAFDRVLQSLPHRDAAPVFSVNPFTGHGHVGITGIEIAAAVNFVAQVWSFEPAGPSQIGLAHLLARNLSTGYLWNKIRVEGGAYGGRASVTSGHPVFACSSYRDPAIAATYAAFTDGLKQVAAGLDESEVEQSVVGTIGRIDMPQTPHEKGWNESLALFYGRSPAWRQELRQGVLGATLVQLSKLAQQILNADSACVVLGSHAAFSAAYAGVAIVEEKLIV